MLYNEPKKTKLYTVQTFEYFPSADMTVGRAKGKRQLSHIRSYAILQYSGTSLTKTFENLDPNRTYVVDFYAAERPKWVKGF
jgi:hypothetical protein